MKTRLALPCVFCLVCFLTLSFFGGCAGTEDSETETPTAGTTPSVMPVVPVDMQAVEELRLRAETIRAQLWQGKIGVPLDWDKTADSLLRAEYARFLLRKGRIAIPFNWAQTADLFVRAEYERALLLKEFGDIPAVHTIADYGKFARLTGASTVTREEFIDFFAAQYKLFPNEANRRALETARKPERVAGPELEKMRIVAPELWAQHKHEQLIRQHGDNPQVDIVANFIRKVELQLPRTDEECHAFLKALRHIDPFESQHLKRFGYPYDEGYAALEARAQLHLMRHELAWRALEKYREAKAKGIPFRLIDWEDGGPVHIID